MKFKRKIKIEDPASTRAATLNRNLTPGAPDPMDMDPMGMNIGYTFYVYFSDSIHDSI